MHTPLHGTLRMDVLPAHEKSSVIDVISESQRLHRKAIEAYRKQAVSGSVSEQLVALESQCYHTALPNVAFASLNYVSG